MWPFRHEPYHWYPCSRLDYYSAQLTGRHTKAIQGLLQNPSASLESTMSSLSTRISLAASTWRNTWPAKPKAAQAASQLAGPRVSNWKIGKPCLSCTQNSSEGIWQGCTSWARLPLHLKSLMVSGTSESTALSFCGGLKGCLPWRVTATIVYRWTGNQSHTALQLVLYNTVCTRA